jgi:hypothetical protein
MPTTTATTTRRTTKQSLEPVELRSRLKTDVSWLLSGVSMILVFAKNIGPQRLYGLCAAAQIHFWHNCGLFSRVLLMIINYYVQPQLTCFRQKNFQLDIWYHNSQWAMSPTFQNNELWRQKHVLSADICSHLHSTLFVFKTLACMYACHSCC